MLNSNAIFCYGYSHNAENLIDNPFTLSTEVMLDTLRSTPNAGIFSRNLRLAQFPSKYIYIHMYIYGDKDIFTICICSSYYRVIMMRRFVRFVRFVSIA